MKRTINIDGIPVEMKCTAATPSFYRDIFGRDLFIEFQQLGKTVQKNGNVDFSIVENLAYTMAYQANRDIGTQIEWLDQFDHATALMDAMKDILDLYVDGLHTISTSKKKTDRQKDHSQ